MSHRAAEFGFKIEGLSYDWSKVIKRSRDVSDKNAAGHRVPLQEKQGRLHPRRSVARKDQARSRSSSATARDATHAAPKILISTGVVSRPLPGLPFDGKTRDREPRSDDPRAAAEEHGHHRRGRDRGGVRLFLQRLRHEGHARRDAAERSAGRRHRSLADPGKMRSRNRASGFSRTRRRRRPTQNKSGVKITVEGKATETIEAEVCLVAIGVQPLLPNGKLQPKLTDRGYIETNDRYETSVPGSLRRGRHHRAAVARARRQLGGDPGGRRNVRRTSSRRKSASSPAAPIASRRSRASA